MPERIPELKDSPDARVAINTGETVRCLSPPHGPVNQDTVMTINKRLLLNVFVALTAMLLLGA